MNTPGPSGQAFNWTETDLWKLLTARRGTESEAVQITLSQHLPSIQQTLSLSGTAPNDFTLHDSGHSFRVAQQMMKIIPADLHACLSDYELALLLLSAYLHDIGMTPAQRKVEKHHDYLLTGKEQDLSPREIEEFRKWLDDAGYEGDMPISVGETTLETLQSARILITGYCRSRHNDWSEEWIRGELSATRLGTYAGWIEDLISLCRSHHQGYSTLIGNRFDCRFVGSPAAPIHLRYLAIALRIADILEFDPERTPEVILNQRNVSPGSLIYWWRDHYISVVQENDRLLLYAQPPNARIHRAIEVLANDRYRTSAL